MTTLDPILNSMSSNDCKVQTTKRDIKKDIKELKMKLAKAIEYTKLKHDLL
jgi:hypothetical protein